jgi:hypothetical protein
MKKRIVLLSIFSLIYTTSFAQIEVAKPERLLPKIGIRAGLNLANFLEEDNDGVTSNSYDLKPGIHAGLFIEIPLGNRFAIEPGVMISGKGYQYSGEWTDSIQQLHEYYASSSPFYIDIPVSFKISQEFGIVRIYGAVGPYLGIGIGGNIYDEEKIDGTKDVNDYKIAWGSSEDNDNYKSIDYGLVFGFGVEVKGIVVSFNYDLGLANISAYTSNGYNIKNRVIRISAAYKFGFLK